MAISSKKKGKSGGARIITYLKVLSNKIFLISIYDKTDSDTIADNEIIERIRDL